jgi:hypothetical protein
MSFPRLAIHTGNTVVATNRHPEWAGTIVIQHNETTATMLKHGPNMTSAAKNRHPLLSTWQSDCRGRHWSDYNADHEYAVSNDVWDLLFFGQEVKDGQVVQANCCGGGCGCAVVEPVAH